VRQERVQFGSDPSHLLSLDADLRLGLLKHFAEPFGFGDCGLRAPKQGIVVAIHDGTCQAVSAFNSRQGGAVP
jgi:hypothetical protein